MNDPTLKHHHHLITGEIVFTGNNDEVNAIRVNGVLIDPEISIPTRLLGKAQQILQLNFHQKMQDDKIKVLDVILLNFTYLGHMTQEEFHKDPEGMKRQEKKESAENKPDLSVVGTKEGNDNGSEGQE
jgi:hypothetical protein